MIEYNLNTVLAYNKQTKKTKKTKKNKAKQNKKSRELPWHHQQKTAKNKNDDKIRIVANSSIQKSKQRNKTHLQYYT